MRRRGALERAVALRAARRGTQSLYKWRDAVALQRRTRALLAPVLLRFRARGAAHAVGGWRDAVALQVALQRRVARVGARGVARAMARLVWGIK